MMCMEHVEIYTPVIHEILKVKDLDFSTPKIREGYSRYFLKFFEHMPGLQAHYWN